MSASYSKSNQSSNELLRDMQIQGHQQYPVSTMFAILPEKMQTEILELIHKSNKLYLHCEDEVIWKRVHVIMTELFAVHYLQKKNKLTERSRMVQTHLKHQANDQLHRKNITKRKDTDIGGVSAKEYSGCVELVNQTLNATFHDSSFTKPIIEAFQEHVLDPLIHNGDLVRLLTKWIIANCIYLPIGTHLMQAYKKDMSGESNYSKYVMPFHKMEIIPEALSHNVIMHMTAFLSEAGQAHCRSHGAVPKAKPNPTAAIISVKNGAGGHTAPAQAIEKRLLEHGWEVKTIHFDEDLSSESDAFKSLGITFEDGSPMTEHLFATRWKMQKHNRKESLAVQFYVNARYKLNPQLFFQENGGELLRDLILPLNPQLIIATGAYHWTWKALSFRVSGAKTLLIATDVFFHFAALDPWYRQQDLATEMRKIHFTTMTDDIQLLKSMSEHHDNYHKKKYERKYPGLLIDSWKHIFSALELDSQISVIGAPIHPAFKAITNSEEKSKLRQKWKISKGAMSVCISRGKLGYDVDLGPALERYRTREILPMPLEIQVVCGENTAFFQKIANGAYCDLGPNIRVIPHPLRNSQDFAEIRAISTLDDIKAGAGSAFEGQYLISQGSQTQLLLTPGAELWWEQSNCDAMEKWGVGFTVKENTNVIEIIKKIMNEGVPKLAKPCLDWKPLFDKCVTQLVPQKNKDDHQPNTKSPTF